MQVKKEFENLVCAFKSTNERSLSNCPNFSNNKPISGPIFSLNRPECIASSEPQHRWGLLSLKSDVFLSTYTFSRLRYKENNNSWVKQVQAWAVLWNAFWEM